MRLPVDQRMLIEEKGRRGTKRGTNMNTYAKAMTLMMGLVVLSSPVPGQSGESTLTLETVRTLWAQPFDVHMDQRDNGTIVSGKLRKSAVNRSHILYGDVWAEVLDAQGTVLAVHTGKPHRASPAKHSRRARFKIRIDELPDDAAALRVGYR